MAKRLRGALVINLIIVVLEIAASVFRIREAEDCLLFYYTQISNFLALIISVIYAVSYLFFYNKDVNSTNDGNLFTNAIPLLRYTSSSMLGMTFLVVMCALLPIGVDAKSLLLTPNGFIQHLLIPVISTFSYLILEKKKSGKRIILLPFSITLAYGLTMMQLNYFGIADGPYPFFRVNQQSTMTSIMWLFVLGCLILAVSYGFTKSKE